jgi:hypothetical protein
MHKPIPKWLYPQVIAKFKELGNYRATARHFSLSLYGVQLIIHPDRRIMDKVKYYTTENARIQKAKWRKRQARKSP